MATQVMRRERLPDFFSYDDDQCHAHFHTRDWVYPVSWWTGADEVNEAGVAYWFPKHVR
jgi:hypothetical protein